MNQYPYLRKYARTDKAWQPSESSATVNRAFETIKTIRDGKEPSIPMLQAVLSLSARPDELPVLVDRSLIEECIRHLDQQRKGDSNYVSPVRSVATCLSALVAFWLRARISIFQSYRAGCRSFRHIEEQKNARSYI